MNNPFVKYLAERGLVTRDAARNLERWLSHAPQPIGMIALSHGLITGHAIDEILERQGETHERFGELAVRMAYLTPSQVERLLEVQRFRRYTTVVEGLALSGQLTIEEATRHFAEFLKETPAAAQMTAGV